MHVHNALRRANVQPVSIAEVGCGAGQVLVSLRASYPLARLIGFDIAPAASAFWPGPGQTDIDFFLGDFLRESQSHYDVILLLDVIEHLNDPFGFLPMIKDRADYFVFHFPLDLSALSVLRESPLLYVREKVGHLHYFTKSLALKLLDECGFEVLDWQYTGAALNAPRRSIKTRVAAMVRRILYALNKDVGVRILGGETLIVVARPKTC